MEKNVESQVRTLLKKSKLSGMDSTRTPLFMLDPQKCTFFLNSREFSEQNFTAKDLQSDVFVFANTLFNLANEKNIAPYTWRNEKQISNLIKSTII